MRLPHLLQNKEIFERTLFTSLQQHFTMIPGTADVMTVPTQTAPLVVFWSEVERNTTEQVRLGP